MLPEGFKRMNELGSKGEAFLFVIDFNLETPLVLSPGEAENRNIYFQVHHQKNFRNKHTPREPFDFTRHPVTVDYYNSAFEHVMKHIRAGNSYLVNLTFPTLIETTLSLEEIFYRSQARYKLLIEDRLVVFSPEKFIQITNDRISSYPMKGTIDASLPDAADRLLNDPKELAEHHTIVDLIRNDLSMVAKQVKVERFRYVEEIETNMKPLLQTSSEITGVLHADYESRIGEILFRLLPAGSVTGAPKQKTVEIIHESELYERNFYTGVMGYFDGTDLDSGVMIRYIEQTPDGMIFKSGGGITSFSCAESEYREMTDKVYVPFT